MSFLALSPLSLRFLKTNYINASLVVHREYRNMLERMSFIYSLQMTLSYPFKLLLFFITLNRPRTKKEKNERKECPSQYRTTHTPFLKVVNLSAIQVQQIYSFSHIKPSIMPAVVLRSLIILFAIKDLIKRLILT